MTHNNQPTMVLDWKSLLIGEMLLLGTLAKTLVEFTDKNWVRTLLDEENYDELPFASEQSSSIAGSKLLQKWCIDNKEKSFDTIFNELSSDYMKLFIGPEKVLAPPWESVYFNDERNIFQEQTLQVRQWYRQFGLEPEKLHSEPDDHVGLEFAFLAHLAQLALQALEADDTAAFDQYLDAQRRFLLEHPLQWVPLWATLVTENARTDFWRGVALLARGVTLELARLHDVKLPKELAA
jgi:putative dimethyl sulfoxide reductase chaperone